MSTFTKAFWFGVGCLGLYTVAKAVEKDEGLQPIPTGFAGDPELSCFAFSLRLGEPMKEGGYDMIHWEVIADSSDDARKIINSVRRKGKLFDPDAEDYRIVEVRLWNSKTREDRVIMTELPPASPIEVVS